MKKRNVLATFLCVLAILSLMQIAFDYLYEAKPGKSVASTSSESKYYIFIEIEDKTLYLLQDGKCIKKYVISSGKSGWPSPLGMWKINEKGDWGEGFGGRWLGLDVPCPV